MTTININELDFDTIKESLKQFMASQDSLTDYNFDASTISMLLDVLAYNTYHNSFYGNMIANEMFLESAVRRDNVVSRAKHLNYVPRSAHGPTAYVNVTISPDDSPASIVIDKNEEFTTTIDDVTYTYVTPRELVVSPDSNGNFTANVAIIEGIPLTHQWTVNSQNPKRYILPNPNIDTRSIVVTIQNSSVDTTQTVWKRKNSLVDLVANSQVYYLQEAVDGKYEIYFGDNIVSKEPEDGNVIMVDYRVCAGSTTNDASTFSPPSTLGGYPFIVNSVTKSSGGDEQESIASVRFNAPRSSEAQDRAVTTGDYKALIRNEFGDIQSISVWGGEDNDPPKYGQVFVSIKPETSNLLTDARKDEILDFLKNKSVLSIDPIITDPVFLYVVTKSTVKYNPELTSKSASAIADLISTAIKSYESNSLGEFGSDFIHSDFVEDIKDSDDSITSVQTSVTLQKKLNPATGAITTYTVEFKHELLDIGYEDTITSTNFTYQGRDKCKLDMSASGNVRIYFIRNGERTYLNTNIGSVDFNTGKITLNALNIEAFEGDNFVVEAIPQNLDASPTRNQILLLSNTRIDVYDRNLKKVVVSTSVETDGSTEDLNESGILNTVF